MASNGSGTMWFMKLPKPAVAVKQPPAFYLRVVVDEPLRVFYAGEGHSVALCPVWEVELHGEDAMFELHGVFCEFDVSPGRVVAAMQAFGETPATVFWASPVVLGLTVVEYELALVMAPTWVGSWDELVETVKVILGDVF